MLGLNPLEVASHLHCQPSKLHTSVALRSWSWDRSRDHFCSRVSTSICFSVWGLTWFWSLHGQYWHWYNSGSHDGFLVSVSSGLGYIMTFRRNKKSCSQRHIGLFNDSGLPAEAGCNNWCGCAGWAGMNEIIDNCGTCGSSKTLSHSPLTCVKRATVCLHYFALLVRVIQTINKILQQVREVSCTFTYLNQCMR